MIEAATHITFRIAVLQPSGEDLIERRSGYNAKLAECRDSPRQPPIGNAGPHAALNNLGMSTLECAHLLFAIGFRYPYLVDIMQAVRGGQFVVECKCVLRFPSFVRASPPVRL